MEPISGACLYDATLTGPSHDCLIEHFSTYWTGTSGTFEDTSIPLGIKSCSKFQPSLLLFDSSDDGNHASVNIVIKINSPLLVNVGISCVFNVRLIEKLWLVIL